MRHRKTARYTGSMDRWILAFIAAGLVGLGGLWMLFVVARTKQVAPGPDGKITLKHGLLFRGFGFLLFVGLLALLGVLAMIDARQEALPKTLLAVMAGAVALLGVIVLWDATQYALTIDSTGLHTVSPWRGPRFISWSDVDRVSFSELNMWFAVEPKSGPAFHVLAIVPGIQQFLASCEANLPTQKLLPAEVGYGWVWRKFPPVKHRDRVRKPWLKTLLVRTVAVVAGLAGLVGLLFTINGTILAAGETPIMRTYEFDRTADSGGQDEKQVVVLTYNIAKAFAHRSEMTFEEPKNVLATLDRLAAAIQLAKPDVVCLQEVMMEAGRLPVDQVEYLARACRLPHVAFGENYNWGLPGYRVVGGNAILSRTPLKPVKNLSLAGRKPFWSTNNNRRALFVESDIYGTTVLIGSVHNDSFDIANNERQAIQLLDFIGDRPCILAGDFNANPNTPPMQRFEESQKFEGRFFSRGDTPPDPNQPLTATKSVKDDPTVPKTYPSHAPDKHLDYVLGPKTWKHLETSVMRWLASDHLPVFSVFGTK